MPDSEEEEPTIETLISDILNALKEQAEEVQKLKKEMSDNKKEMQEKTLEKEKEMRDKHEQEMDKCKEEIAGARMSWQCRAESNCKELVEEYSDNLAMWCCGGRSSVCAQGSSTRLRTSC